MKEFNEKVAVITGAASGIGRALADRCAREGMKVVLAGINEDTLVRAKNELEANGARVLAVPTDVSKLEDVQRLAEETISTFGAVHLLFNNAGVAAVDAAIWNHSVTDWQWVLGVNLWGVIHGLHVFVPIMLSQKTEGHIVNTASIAGLITTGLGIYGVSKHAVLSLSEAANRDLTLINANVKVSVLCPGVVKTKIVDAARNRPSYLSDDPSSESRSTRTEALISNWGQRVEAGMAPSAIADHVFAALRDDAFYIITHPEHKPAIKSRMEDILSERKPRLLKVVAGRYTPYDPGDLV